MKYRSDDLARLLAGTYMRVHRRIDAAMAAEGASLARTKMLLIIEKHAGEARAADLAAYLGQAPRTVTEALDGLERDGLIARTADSADRRVKRLAITQEGRRAIAATEPLRMRLTGELFASLEPAECQALGATLEKLVAALDDDPSCSAFRS
ncbi:MarR family winged helix-turn-helix transcriptional regulator [Sphingomonas yantingensis]|jgi:DNA-binding MarR family transcriptional regulator|uniref:DNA-binding MarR family transcriptional regulator n=1 Tax=Sphingomonas yantingensis TaxID=1241761 RepID=A0A7W9AMV7_9SPHN|nr:MarR family transcriptional regulator [Sphingomonas yantingensis]MBB5697345.1 DNA-binding MarR family transcriptional regulator [Sphingomonas yantingensis]